MLYLFEERINIIYVHIKGSNEYGVCLFVRIKMLEQMLGFLWKKTWKAFGDVSTSICLLITVAGRAVSGMNCLHSLERWDSAFDYHSRYGCLCVFILFVLSCV
jgi:hypothetical protein